MRIGSVTRGRAQSTCRSNPSLWRRKRFHREVSLLPEQQASHAAVVEAAAAVQVQAQQTRDAERGALAEANEQEHAKEVNAADKARAVAAKQTLKRKTGALSRHGVL